MNKRMKWFIYPAIPYNFCLYVVSLVLQSYNCAPRPGQPWGFDNVITCGKNAIFSPIRGILNVAIDVYIFALPIPLIARLHMSNAKRFGLLGIFFTAGL